MTHTTGVHMTTGKFIKMGSKMGTTYAETGNAMYDLIDDFYKGAYSLAKSAGSATYQGRDGNGYFNSIMGKEITAAMFSSDNVFTALGAKPYNHEGVRIATELATYGMSDAAQSDAANGTGYVDSVSGRTDEDLFLGVGATTIQDGSIPASVKMPVEEFREPYKDLPFSFDYGLGLQALEAKDDTIAYKDYVEKVSANYSDLIDKTLLRPLTVRQPKIGTVETSLTGIARAICSGTEITAETWSSYGDITPEMVSPYGGANGDFYSWRADTDGRTSKFPVGGGTGSTTDAASIGSSHRVNNLDGNVVDLNGGVLSIGDMKKLYRLCQINWNGNYDNKVFTMSNVAQDKLGALMMANNVYLDSVYVERSFNGGKTIPGRDAGMLLAGFQNIPIIQDGNINFDFSTKRVSATKFGEIMLLDLHHIWMSMLTPVELFNINNPAITRQLQERNVMSMRAETRIDSFIQHGRLKGLANDE